VGEVWEQGCCQEGIELCGYVLLSSLWHLMMYCLVRIVLCTRSSLSCIL
jgi:hypothetical protein